MVVFITTHPTEKQSETSKKFCVQTFVGGLIFCYPSDSSTSICDMNFKLTAVTAIDKRFMTSLFWLREKYAMYFPDEIPNNHISKMKK